MGCLAPERGRRLADVDPLPQQQTQWNMRWWDLMGQRTV